MGLISLDQLKKDMVLANHVKDLSGRLLAAKGLKLTEGHLRLFKTWGSSKRISKASLPGILKKTLL